MTGESGALTAALPWSLSHYIPLNGFHPLYRALVDHAPAGLRLNAWDNVRLHRHLASNAADREALLAEAAEARREARSVADPVEQAWRRYRWAPNQVLTSRLAGDIELHHTAAFPSMERPFILHCESFSPVFLPFNRQNPDVPQRPREMREHYRHLFAHPLCLGIFSHIPETLESFRRYFADPEIDRKLFDSRIGLSRAAFGGPPPLPRPALSAPRFLFVNSANQNTANFFLRGGHVVLRFWERFRAAGREGRLILRCGRPEDAELSAHGVDTGFVRRELGRSILWAQDYLTGEEMNALIANAHFFLLPGVALHSVSIMQAMCLGALPVVTDAVGTSVYVSDGFDGIVLQGGREAGWRVDPQTGVPVDVPESRPDLDAALAMQMEQRIGALLEDTNQFARMQAGAAERASSQFDGEAFAHSFWADVRALCPESAAASRPSSGTQAGGLGRCLLEGDSWARVFESCTQPMRRMQTGVGTVTELGGAIVYAEGNPEIELNHWSVMAQHWKFDAPKMSFAESIEALEGAYLVDSDQSRASPVRRFTRAIGRMLRPFPELHSAASTVLRRYRQYRRHQEFRRALRAQPQPEAAGPAPDPAQAAGELLPRNPKLVLEGYHRFNIIHYRARFYAILQGEGAFEPGMIGTPRYTCSFSGETMLEVQVAIKEFLDREAGPKEEVR